VFQSAKTFDSKIWHYVNYHIIVCAVYLKIPLIEWCP